MLRTRILTSIVLISSFLAALFLLPNLYWSLLMLAVVSIGAWEWAALAKFSSLIRNGYVLITIASGLAITFAADIGLPDLQARSMFYGILAAALFWILFAPIFLISRYQIKSLLGLAVLGWLVLLPTWLALVSLHQISPFLLLVVMATVWIADSAAYFAGKRYGKRKLAQDISPGKTWEGVWGAWLAVGIYGLGLCLFFGFNYWIIVGLWGITVLSVIGDLLESLIKRQAGVKDSSDLLPGHGGLLDRIDGLTSSLPLVVFFIYFPLYFRLYYLALPYHG
ncbi:MAG TPA: phosphatidate cytidylyltransferase [Methylophilaceae bacterium]|nr:phosphatidate cytidylyltransferase [Methylophilaceae bacterium]